MATYCMSENCKEVPLAKEKKKRPSEAFFFHFLDDHCDVRGYGNNQRRLVIVSRL